jgi:hypothetical protein
MRFLGFVALVAACQAPTIDVAPTTTSGPLTITVESWNLGLISKERDATAKTRLDNISDALDKDSSADVLCLSNVTIDDAREAILTRARKQYPYHAFVRTDRNTPTEDLQDLTGVARTIDMTPPCSNAEDVARLDAQALCARDKCRDATGIIAPSCVTTECASLPLPEGPRCKMCLATASIAEKAEDIHRTCVDTPRGELPADGRLGAVIFSRYPIRADFAAHVYPSTPSVKGALTATIDVSKDRSIDVICASMDTWVRHPQYAGQFDAPLPGFDIFEYLIAHRELIELAWKLGERRPTFLLGACAYLWILNGSGAAQAINYYDFAANLNPLHSVVSNSCTVCRNNPLAKAQPFGTAALASSFEALLFVRGIAPEIGELTITRNALDYSYGGKPAPASFAYGARATLQL